MAACPNCQQDVPSSKMWLWSILTPITCGHCNAKLNPTIASGLTIHGIITLSVYGVALLLVEMDVSDFTILLTMGAVAVVSATVATRFVLRWIVKEPPRHV